MVWFSCGLGVALQLALALVPVVHSEHVTTSAAPMAAPNFNVTEDDLERATPTPCSCGGGQCGCCTGMLLQQFNINIRQKGCVNITYDPDDFAFNMALSWNNRQLYTNTISGKNPRPACIQVPRFPNAKFCVKFSNVYFIDRNLHACIDTELSWNDFTMYESSLDCIRIGANGLAILKPEEGGGLPQGGGGGGGDEDVEEYDDPEDDDGDDDE